MPTCIESPDKINTDEIKPAVIEVITESTLNDYLHIYDPRHRYIECAEYDIENRCLTAIFKGFEYPFSKKVKHFTREQAVAFLTQAAFILGGELVRHGNLHPLTHQQYLTLCEKEKVTFARVSINFKRHIENKPGLKIRMSCDRYKKVGARILGNLSYEFEDGVCHGESLAMITME